MTSLLQWVAGTTKTVAVPQNAKLQRITNTSPPHFFSALLILAFDQYHGYDDYDNLYFCVTYYVLGTTKGWLISLLFSQSSRIPKDCIMYWSIWENHPSREAPTQSTFWEPSCSSFMETGKTLANFLTLPIMFAHSPQVDLVSFRIRAIVQRVFWMRVCQIGPNEHRVFIARGETSVLTDLIGRTRKQMFSSVSFTKTIKQPFLTQNFRKSESCWCQHVKAWEGSGQATTGTKTT